MKFLSNHFILISGAKVRTFPKLATRYYGVY